MEEFQEVKHVVSRILAIADMHCLSPYGLSTEQWTAEDGTVCKANQGQQLLLKYWKHLMYVLRTERWKVDEVWVVGDVFSGLDPAEKGRKTRGSLDEQMRVAVELLSMLPKVTIKVFSGSPYHESLDVRMHELLAVLLSKEGFNARFRGAWSIEKIGERKRAFVCHESSPAAIHPHTYMLRDSRWFKVQAFDGKFPRVDLIVRAHTHSARFVDDRGIKIVSLPGWQVFVPWSKTLKMFPSYIPDIGGEFILLDKDDRIKVQEWLYPPFTMTEDGQVIWGDYDPARYARIEEAGE